jgi:hypothetical protein
MVIFWIMTLARLSKMDVIFIGNLIEKENSNYPFLDDQNL